MPLTDHPKYPSFSVNLPADLRRALASIAARELCTVGHVIRRACVLEVERHQRARRRFEREERAVAS